MFTATQLNSLFKLWSARGPALTGQINGLLQFISQSPYDVSSVAGPTLLIAQTFARAQSNILDFIMNDASFAGWSFDMQHQISLLEQDWQDLYVLLSSVAFDKQLPRFDTIYQASVGARYYGAQVQAEAQSIDIKLESFLNVPTMAGITVKTFWNASSLGLKTLSLLATLDWSQTGGIPDPAPPAPPATPYSGPLTPYYGPMATTDDLIADALEMLTEVAPLQPDISMLLSMIANVSPNGFSTDSIVSIVARDVMQGADIESIAYQYLGDAEQWIPLAEFNKLMWPYISDDPIEQLGRPEVEGLTLGASLAVGTNQVFLANGNYPVYKDQRLLLQDGMGNFQIVTVVDASGFPALMVSPALTDTFIVSSTSVTLYPPVYDTGVVLGTGDKILIPSTLLVAAGVLDTVATDLERFGTDLQLTQDGELIAANGDFMVVTGQANLKQAITNRFEVPRGQLIHLPLYGTGLNRFIGLKGTPQYGVAAGVDAIQTVLQDPRTPKAITPQVQIVDDKMLIDFGVAVDNQRLLLPVQLDLPAS